MKYVLKRAMLGMLSLGIVARSKKGFGISLARWFQQELLPVLREVCLPHVFRRGDLVRPDMVERLLAKHRQRLRDHRKKLRTLLAFLLWIIRHRPV